MRWLTSLSSYNGAPIALRVHPHEDVLEFQSGNPNLIIISHALKHVANTGLPEPDYLDSLAPFDKELLATFTQSNGLTVIVETCAGNRNYYGYVSDAATIKSLFKAVRLRHPHQKITFRTRPDPTWNFYNKYRAVFQW